MQSKIFAFDYTTMWQEAETHLSQADPQMAEVIALVGPCGLRREPDAWRALSSSIIGQQVSTHAARAIRGRFAALVENEEYPTPQNIGDLSDEALRGAGLSGNKARSIRDLAAHFLDGRIEPQSFAALDDESIIAALLPVRGIGRWTAEMFLLFSLNRPDVWAVDDLGLRRAVRAFCAARRSCRTRKR